MKTTAEFLFSYINKFIFVINIIYFIFDQNFFNIKNIIKQIIYHDKNIIYNDQSLHHSQQLDNDLIEGIRSLSSTSHDGPSSLFLATSYLNPIQGSCAILIIICFVSIIKKFFDILHYITFDTSFNAMLTLIEEELMIVGVSSFIFKIITNTTHLSTSTWYIPLEFSEILIPLLAFSYCMMGVLLIISSLNQVYWWTRAHHMQVMEILDDYFRISTTLLFR